MIFTLTAFVACGENGEDKGREPSTAKITLTEDMTVDDILVLLPQIENMTIDVKNSPTTTGSGYNLTIYISKIGTLLHYEYESGIINNEIYLFDDDEMRNEALSQYISEIKSTLFGVHEFDRNDWIIEEGKLITYNQSHEREVVYKNFNCTEIDFDYYLSLDVPTFGSNG